MRVDWIKVALVFAVLAYVALMLSTVFAHDHDNPQLNGWFKELKSKNGPCCDGADAMRLDDPDWDNDAGHYRVRLEGKWVDVPPEAVVEGPNKSGVALVWPYVENGRMERVRCFMPGTAV